MKKRVFKTPMMAVTITVLISLVFIAILQVSASAGGYVFQENFQSPSNNGYVWGANDVSFSNTTPINGWTMSNDSGIVKAKTTGKCRVNADSSALTKAYHSFTNGTGGDVTLMGSVNRSSISALSVILYSGTTQVAKIRFPTTDGGACSYVDNTNTERIFADNAFAIVGSAVNTFKIVLKWDASAGAFTSAEYYFNGGITTNTMATLAADTIGSTNTITNTSVDTLAFGESVLGGNIDFDDITVYTDGPINLPQANLPTVLGTPKSSQMLTANYTYSGDIEEASTIQWQQSDSMVESYTDIVGATSKTFIVTLAQVGKFIRYQIIPKDRAGNIGATEFSAATEAITETLIFPSATVDAISGSPKTGAELTGLYTYTGEFEEQSSILQWQVASGPTLTYTDIIGATSNVFIPTPAQTGKYLRFKVMPRDTQGTLGTAIFSAPTTVVTGTLATPAIPTASGKIFKWTAVPGASSYTVVLSKTGIGVMNTYTGITTLSQDCAAIIDANGAGTYSATVQAIGTGEYLNSLLSESLSKTWYSITYYANTGTGLVPIDIMPYSTGSNYYVKDNIGDPPLTREGYTFAGWATAEGIDGAGSGTFRAVGVKIAMGTDNVVFYARWAANTLTVTYKANGGTGTQIDNNLYAPNVSQVLVQASDGITREGYTLSGWIEEGNGLPREFYARFIIGASNVTLVAQWVHNAALDGLVLSIGQISPNFSSNIESYTVSVSHDVATLNITPVGNDVVNYITVNDVGVASGTSKSVLLNVGDNTITVTATAQNYTVKIYTIKVTRLAGTGTDKYSVKGTVAILTGADLTKVSIVAKQLGVSVGTFAVAANGTFEISLEPGEYNLEIARDGYITKKISNFTVTTEANQTLSASSINLIAGDVVVTAQNTINLQDLQTILSNFGLVSSDASFNAKYDLNDDGRINLIDLQAILTNFGLVQ